MPRFYGPLCPASHPDGTSSCVKPDYHEFSHMDTAGRAWPAGRRVSSHPGPFCAVPHPDGRGASCSKPLGHREVHLNPDGEWWGVTGAVGGTFSSHTPRLKPVSHEIVDPERAELDRVATLLIAEWQRVEGGKVNVSYIETFVDLARVVIADRRHAAVAATPAAGVASPDGP